MERNTSNFTLSPPTAICPTLLFDRSVPTEITADVSLPDYLPEVKRLLRVTATPYHESRFLSANAAAFDGRADLLICYAGGDGGLYSTRLSRDFTVNLPIDPELMAQGIDPAADTRVESVAARATAPRKINLRLRLRTRIRAHGEEDLTPTVEGAPLHTERLIKRGRTVTLLHADDQPMDLAEDIPLADVEGEVRLISADGAVAVAEAVADGDAVNCRGELVLTLLTCAAEGQGSSERRVCRIPFTRTVAMPGARSGMQARAWGSCCDLAVTVEDDRLLCDAAIRLSAEAVEETEIAPVADLFAPGGTVENAVYRDVETERNLLCGNYAVPLSGRIPAAGAGIDPAARIEDVACTAQLDEMTFEGGRLTLIGTCRCSVIRREDGEYGAAEVTLPWRKVLECPEEPTRREAELAVIRADARMEGEGESAQLAVEAEICAALRMSRGESRRVLSRALYRPAEGRRGAAVTVCYPEAGESLWSVARRYGVSLASLAAMNDLQADENCDLPASLGGRRFLLLAE